MLLNTRAGEVAMPSSLSHLPSSLILIGAGKMGGSMLEGWLAHGLDPSGTSIFDPQPSEAITALCDARGIALNPDRAPPDPQVVVLAIKPQGLAASAAQANALLGASTLVVSVM